MNKIKVLLVLASAASALAASAGNAPEVDALFDSIAAPRLFVARVEAPEGTGFVLTLPSGQFLDERTLAPGNDRPQTDFIALGAGDTLYTYSRGVLRTSLELVRPSGSSHRWLPAQLVEGFRRDMESSPERNVIESIDDGTIVFAHPVRGHVLGRTIINFDPETYALKSVRRNAGPESEPKNELVLAEYTPVSDFALPEGGITRRWLQERYPDAFVERLPHTFMKKVHTAGRVDLHDEASDAIVVVLEATDPATPGHIAAVRALAAGRPIYWAFRDTKIEDILEVMPAATPGETALSNALGLRMQAPLMLVVRDGVIAEKRKL
ncbi:MAG: hypothetical protein K2M06_02715 [Muribaculaceae bacterium]|nr:hypothetical protein [Muribaculaceae bacterium]